MKFKISLIAALIFSVIFSTAAFAASVTLINRTGRDIEALYISPVARNQWERYYSEGEYFESDDSMRVHVESRRGVNYWDIRCRYANGKTDTWYGVDLSGTVILRRNGNFSNSGGSNGRRRYYYDDEDYDDWNDKRY